jgi:hypothetical protein
VTSISAKAFSTGKNGVKNATVYSASEDVLDGVVFAGTVKVVSEAEDAAEAEEAASTVAEASGAAEASVVTASANVAESSGVEAPANAAESSVVEATETEAAPQTETPVNTDAAVAEETPDVQETVVAEQNGTVTEATAAEENATVTEATAGEENAAVTEEPSETETTEDTEDADASTGENPTAEDPAEVEAEEQTEDSDATIEPAAESDGNTGSVRRRVGSPKTYGNENVNEDKTDNNEISTLSDNKFAVGSAKGASYETLAEAVRNLGNETTIYVIADDVSDSSLAGCKDAFTLNLNGKYVSFEISGTCDSAITIEAGDEVYFGAGTYNGTITVTNVGTVGFENGTYNGAIKVTGNQSATAEVNFNGGTYTGDITVSEAPKVNFNGGTYTGDITVSGGDVTFEDGDFSNANIVSNKNITINNGDFSSATIKLNGNASLGFFNGGTFKETTFSLQTKNDGAGALFKGSDADFSEAKIIYNYGDGGSLVILDGGTYGTIEEISSGKTYESTFGLCISNNTTIKNLSTTRKDGLIDVTVTKSAGYVEEIPGFACDQAQIVSFVSKNNKPISLKIDNIESKENDTWGSYWTFNVSMTGVDGCKGWYLGDDVKKDGIPNLKLCNRATYTFAASYENSGDIYYASYDENDTDQMSITIPEKNSTTMRLQLARDIPEAYTVTLIGIKYSTNKLLQSVLEDSAEKKGNTVDLTSDSNWGADEITKTLLSDTDQQNPSYREVSATENNNVGDDDRTLGNNETASVDLKVGSANKKAYVYALGYATVEDAKPDEYGNKRTFTIYTGLYALTLDGTKVNTKLAAQ